MGSRPSRMTTRTSPEPPSMARRSPPHASAALPPVEHACPRPRP
jgi:hypothetical protein